MWVEQMTNVLLCYWIKSGLDLENSDGCVSGCMQDNKMVLFALLSFFDSNERMDSVTNKE